jgi:hypothetical protein
MAINFKVFGIKLQLPHSAKDGTCLDLVVLRDAETRRQLGSLTAHLTGRRSQLEPDDKGILEERHDRVISAICLR